MENVLLNIFQDVIELIYITKYTIPAIACLLLFLMIKEMTRTRIAPIPNPSQRNSLFLTFPTNRKETNHAISILKILSLPRSTIATSVIQKSEKESDNTLLKELPFEHIFTLHQNNVKFVYEIHTSSNGVSIQFAIPRLIKNKDDEEALIDNVEVLRSSLKAINPQIRFKLLTGSELYRGYKCVIPEEIDEIIVKKDHAQMALSNGENKYMALLKIKMSIENFSKKNHIDAILNGFVTENINSSMLIFVRPRKSMITKILQVLNKQKHLEKCFDPFTYDTTKRNAEKSKMRLKSAEEIDNPWEATIFFIVRANTLRNLERYVKKVIAILMTTFRRNSRIKIKRLKGNALRRGLLVTLTRYIDSYDFNVTSFELSNIVMIPEDSHPGLPRTEIPKFEIPDGLLSTKSLNALNRTSDESSAKVLLGYTLWQDNVMNPIYIPLSDLVLHAVILGESGFGKTYFVKEFLRNIYDIAPEVNWLIFDYKGEYRQLKEEIKEVRILTPGSDKSFGINIFETHADTVKIHKQKIFAMLYDTISTIAPKSEYSPQMEKCLKDAISRTVDKFSNNKNKTNKRPFDVLFDTLDEIAQERKSDMPTIVYSVEGIKARLDRFKNGILGDIFNTNTANLNSRDFINGKVIIDFNQLIRLGVTRVELRFLMAIIFKYILDAALRERNTKLRHITVIEEANLLLSQSNTEMEGIFESAVLNVRSFGEGLIFIAQRPTISENILVNAGIKVLFRNSWESSTLAKYVNLDSIQEDYLKTLPIGEAIAMVPEYPYPFRIAITEYSGKQRLRKFEITKMVNNSNISNETVNQEVPSNNMVDIQIKKEDLFAIATEILESRESELIRCVLEELSKNNMSLSVLYSRFKHQSSSSIINKIIKMLANYRVPLVVLKNDIVMLTDVGRAVSDLLTLKIETY